MRRSKLLEIELIKETHYMIATLRDQEFVDVTRELAASRQKAIDAKSDYLSQIAALSKEIKETRRELKTQESFVYQVAETNKELADAKDRGRALLRDDSARSGKRHNSKTRNHINGLQQQGQVMLYRATMAASSSSVQAPNVLKPFDSGSYRPTP